MHRNKLYKRIALVVIFVLSISAAVIYFTFDIRALDYLTMFSSWSVLCALGALAIGLFFDGTRLLTCFLHGLFCALWGRWPSGCSLTARDF